jgi:hypothetical protein
MLCLLPRESWDQKSVPTACLHAEVCEDEAERIGDLSDLIVTNSLGVQRLDRASRRPDLNGVLERQQPRGTCFPEHG